MRPAGNDLLARFLASLDNVSAWARAHDLDDTMLCHLKKGDRNPSLAVAQKLETATGGVVPCMSWPTSR
jgi:hypothetical protein